MSAGASCMCITLAYVAVLYAGASRERVRTVSVRVLYTYASHLLAACWLTVARRCRRCARVRQSAQQAGPGRHTAALAAGGAGARTAGLV